MLEITAVGPDSSLIQVFNSPPSGSSIAKKSAGLFASLLALQITPSAHATPKIGLESACSDCESSLPDKETKTDASAQSVAELIAGGLLLSPLTISNPELIPSTTPTVGGGSVGATNPTAVADLLPMVAIEQKQVPTTAGNQSAGQFVSTSPKVRVGQPIPDTNTTLPSAPAETQGVGQLAIAERSESLRQPAQAVPKADGFPRIPLSSDLAGHPELVAPTQIQLGRVSDKIADSTTPTVTQVRVPDTKSMSEQVVPPITNSSPATVQNSSTCEIPIKTSGELSVQFALPLRELESDDRNDLVTPQAQSSSDFAAMIQNMRIVSVTSDPRPLDATARPVESPLAAQVADGIVTHAKLFEHSDSHEFQLRLDPPELGEVKVRLLATADRLQAEVTVSSDAVRGMIESQLPELRQRLEAAGLSVSRFDVNTQTGGGSHSHHQQHPSSLWELPFDRSFPGSTVSPPTPSRVSTLGGTLDVTA